MSKVRFGTCSWKYDSWNGIVYSGKKNINYLEEYSRHFDTVEIDQWFWSLHGIDKVTLPREKDVKLYTDSVPDNFKFSVKIPNSITLTHFYTKKKGDPLVPNPYFLSNDLFDQFLSTIKPFGDKTGPLMFQFEYLNKQKMSGLSEFIERFESFLDECDRTFTYGIEIRNPNYLNKSFFDFLNRNKLSMVFLQGYYMPSVFELYKKFKNHIQNTTVLRLHGPDRAGIEKLTGGDWSAIVEPKDDDIKLTAEFINFITSKKVDLYVNVNNHFEGSAPLTIKRIKEQL